MKSRDRERVHLEDDNFAIGDGDVAVGRKAADAVVARGTFGRVVDVDKMIRGKVRVERDAEDAALAVCVNLCGKVYERRREQRVVFDDDDAARLLRDEEATVGRKLHRHGVRQTCSHFPFRKSRGQCGGASLCKRDDDEER